MELSSAEIRKRGDMTAKAEAAASSALTEARKLITARQIEAKGKEDSAAVGAELVSLQSRLNTALAEINRLKKLASTVDQRLAAKRVLEEGEAKCWSQVVTVSLCA